MDTTEAQLAEMGAAADAADASLLSVGAVASGTGAGLDAAGGSAAAAGAGLDELAASADAAGAGLTAADVGLADAAASADAAAVSLDAAAVAEAAAGDEAVAAGTQFSIMGEMAKGTESSVKSFIGGIPLMAAAAVVALGALAVHMAGDFQESMTALVTGAGESEKNLGMVSQGVLNMAVQTGTSTKDLSDGLYMIESAGYHGAAGLQVLNIAAEAAKVGNASLADVANGVTTAMTDYASQNLSAASAANALIATVAAGKTHMTDLSQSLSAILPVASSVGVKFNDVMASMATMTGEGVPAADAATYLRQMLMALENPASKGAAALKSIGLSSSAVANEMKKSLPGALQMITDALSKKFKPGSQAYIAALSAISGGTKQMQGMLDLTGTHLKTFKANVETIAGSVKKGGASVTGWSLVQQDFNFKMAQAGQVLQTGMIRAGTALLPLIGALAQGFVSIASALGGFIGWLNKGSAAATLVKGALAGMAAGILVYLATVIPPLLASFIAWAGAALGAAATTLLAAAPFIAVGVAIGLVVAAIVLAIQHWGAIVTFFQGLWTTVWGAVSSFFVSIWQRVASFFEGIFNRFKAVFIALGVIMGIMFAPLIIAIAAIAAPFVGLFLLFTHFHQVLTLTQSIARAAWQGILNAITAPIRLIVAAFDWLYQHNTYFQELVDKIKAIVTAGLAFVEKLWQHDVAVVVGWWNDLKSAAESVWNALSTMIHTVLNFIGGLLVAFWNREVQGWTTIYNRVKGIVTTLWADVTHIFQAAWGGISGAMQSLWSRLVSFVSGWPSQAVQWGVNLIKGFINGILSMVGSVGSAIGSIAGKVAGFLGFHSPTKEGPGHEADKWAPAFIKMYTAGLLAGLPQIAAAAQKLMKPIAVSLNPTAGSLTSSAIRPYTYLPPSQASNTTQSGATNQPVILQIDGRQFARVIMPLIVDQLRYRVGVIAK